jgi:predicted site-specific integrase-resolvase
MFSKRPKLKTLFNLVENHEITKVVVKHKDRLSRFNFDVYERFFANNGVNESANIGRKVIRDEDVILRLDRSVAATPVRANPLKIACV